MNARTLTQETQETRYFDIAGLRNYLSLGAASCRNIAADAGAVVRYGKRVLYDKALIDKYLDEMRKQQLMQV